MTFLGSFIFINIYNVNLRSALIAQKFLQPANSWQDVDIFKTGIFYDYRYISKLKLKINIS